MGGDRRTDREGTRGVLGQRPALRDRWYLLLRAAGFTERAHRLEHVLVRPIFFLIHTADGSLHKCVAVQRRQPLCQHYGVRWSVAPQRFSRPLAHPSFILQCELIQTTSPCAYSLAWAPAIL